MWFKMNLNGSGSAFTNHEDLAEVLLEVRNRVKAGEESGIVHDYNGNTIGKFIVGDEY